MGKVRFVCLVCRENLDNLASLIRHFEERHGDLPDVSNWRLFRLNGRRYGSWRKYRDLREGGLVKVVRR